MDIPRAGARRSRIIRRSIWGTIIVCAILLTTWGLSRLKPAAPTVERGTVWIESVKRGDIDRQVRGLGTLVPEEVFWIAADNTGRVDQVKLKPGVRVEPNTVIMVLSNPQLQLDAEDLKWQIKAAEANYTDLKVKLESQKLDLQSAVARVESETVQAQLKYERDVQLAKEGLAPDLDLKLSRAAAQESAKREVIEKQRLDIFSESVQAQLASQTVNIEKVRAAYDLKKKQVDELIIRAGTSGVLQDVPLEVGQSVAIGTVLAKVAQPSKLKAELKIAETQAKDIEIGQPASIDTRNGIIPGHVSRIDPAVVNGTVTVDVKLEGELPKGARPDLSVDGTVQLEKLNDIMYVQRPVFGNENSTVGLFKLDPKTNEATRVQVKLGRSSVTNIEVLDGLHAGDQVVLSDMSAWDAYDRIRIVQ